MHAHVCSTHADTHNAPGVHVWILHKHAYTHAHVINTKGTCVLTCVWICTLVHTMAHLYTLIHTQTQMQTCPSSTDPHTPALSGHLSAPCGLGKCEDV